MKVSKGKIIVTVLCLSFFIGVPVFAGNPQTDLDALLEKWTTSLTDENVDGFLDCYWDDAVRINYFPGQEPGMVEGQQELRAGQNSSFERLDFQSMGLIYDPPIRYFPGNGRPVYVYPNSRFGFIDVFEFEERRGEYRIIRQYLLPHPQ